MRKLSFIGGFMKNENDLRVLKTQKALCEALMQLLEYKRFDSISVSELCDHAMVRRATFYKHFYDKYDFWHFFVNKKRKEFLGEAPDDLPQSDIKEYCLYCFTQSIKFFKSHRSIVESIVNSDDACLLIDSFMEEIGANILAFLNAENKEYVTDTETIALFISGGIVSLLRRWFLNGNTVSEKKAMEEFEKLMAAFNI